MPKLWTKDFVLALVVSLFMGAVMYLTMTTMALYAVERFAAGDAQAGLAASMYIVGALVSRFWAGAAVDSLGPRRVMRGGLVLFALASLAYVPAQSLWPFLAVRFVHGLAYGTAQTAVGAVVQSLIPSARRAEGTSYHGISITLATALGPLLAAVLLRDGNYTSLFVATAVASIASLVVALAITPPGEDAPRLAPDHAEHQRGPLLSRIIEPAAVPISTMALVVGGSYSGILTFFTPFADSVGQPAAPAAFFLVYSAAILLVRVFAGRLQDRRGPNVVMYPAIVSFAAAMAVLAASETTPLFLVAAVLAGLGWGTVHSAGQAIAVQSAPLSRVGRSVSTYFLMLDVGTGLGPVLLGLLVTARGYAAMYGVLAVVILAGVGQYWLVHGRWAARRR